MRSLNRSIIDHIVETSAWSYPPSDSDTDIAWLRFWYDILRRISIDATYEPWTSKRVVKNVAHLDRSLERNLVNNEFDIELDAEFDAEFDLNIQRCSESIKKTRDFRLSGGTHPCIYYRRNWQCVCSSHTFSSR